MVTEMRYIVPVVGFTKLFSTIVHSTVWREEKHVKIVWITMLALADRNGRIMASVPGLADASKVSIEECVEALAHLSSPDKWSRTKTAEGRRVCEIDGGWQLLNYIKYRELRDEDAKRIAGRERVRKHRALSRSSVTVTRRNANEEAEAEEEEEADRRKSFEQRWDRYPRKKGKDDARRHFLAQVKTPEDLQQFDSAIRNYVEEIAILATAEKFIMHGSTFFNQKWRDYVDGTWQRPKGDEPKRHHSEFDAYRD